MLHDEDHLFQLLSEKAVVITPNNRLSESLQERYFNYQKHQTLIKPNCFSYNTFIEKSYKQLVFNDPHHQLSTLLAPTQIRQIWRRILKKHHEIKFSDTLLHSVVTAWERCQLWQINSEHPLFHATVQTMQFKNWWKQFDDICKQNSFICPDQLTDYLIHNHFYLQHPVVWVCFDDFTPQHQTLQRYMQRQNINQFRFEPQRMPTSIKLYTAKDNQHELESIVCWIKEQLALDNRKIAIVVPELQQQEAQIKRVLDFHFEEQTYNVSLGQSLDTFPIIAHALICLQLSLESLSIHEASLLLQSPYLGGAKKEFAARSQFLEDSELFASDSIGFKLLLQHAQKYAPELFHSLGSIHPYPQSASVEEWIDLFHRRLSQLGFPGDYGLNSQNYQCYNRFNLLFDEFRQFRVLSSHLSQVEALEILRCLLKNTIFQPQKLNAPVQILGLLEASGCNFESIWVMGLTDQCLPQKVKLSPFIPAQLQREVLMPHSCPERELRFAQQIIHRIQHCAATILFSYPQWSQDSLNLPCTIISNFEQSAMFSNDHISAKYLISRNEEYVHPLAINSSVIGGTALLANQAKCPFKAFATHRLKAKALFLPTEGISAMERGQLIHKIMELLWAKIKNQKQLLSLSQTVLEQWIDETILHVLGSGVENSLALFSDLDHHIEQLRLKRLVLDVLDWERHRAPFTIEHIEQEFTIALAGLEFKIRVDRIDSVANEKWVIDYKSTLPITKPWNEERPVEPQLLIYALLDEDISALMFLQLKAGKIVCSGHSQEKQLLPGLSTPKKDTNWNQSKQKWNRQLSELAKEYQQGFCEPKPIESSLCQRCDFKNLCRY